MFRFGWSRALVALLAALLLTAGLGVVDSGRVVAQSLPVDNGDGTFTNADGTVTVPFFWDLKPAGLGAGDKFRLLFRTNSQDHADETGIGWYNTFVQNSARFGHSAIRRHSSTFRVVGSTSAVDARDNAKLGPSDVVAPVYWLNGKRISQDYSTTAQVGFWATTWENFTTEDLRDEDGNSLGNFGVWTGSNADGTKHATEYLGASGDVKVGAASGSRPIEDFFSWDSGSSLFTFYGVSPVYVVAAPPSVPVVNADGTVTVPFWWSLNPAGSRAGDKFRLLFLTSTARNARSTDIAVYNQFVQARAAAGHRAIRGHSSTFRVVGSTPSVNARVNAKLGSSDVVAPVYWLGGSRVSRDYGSTAGQGFWSTAWESSGTSNLRDELGRKNGSDADQFQTASTQIPTGTNTNGTTASDPLGGSQVEASFTFQTQLISSGGRVTTNSQYNFLGISPVYVIAANPHDCDDGDGDAATLKLFETAVADSYCDFFAPSGTVWRSVDSVRVTKLELAPEVAPESVFGDPRVVTADMDITDTALHNERIFHDREHFVDRTGGHPDRSNYAAYFNQPVASPTGDGFKVIHFLAHTVDNLGLPRRNQVDDALMKKLADSLVTVDLASFDGETGTEVASLRFRDGPLCASAHQLGEVRAVAARAAVVDDPNTPRDETRPAVEAVAHEPGLFPYGVFGYFWGKYPGSGVEGRTAACVQFELEVTLSPADDSTPKTIKVRVKDNQNGRHSVFSEEYPKHTVQQQQETSSSDVVSAQLLADVKGYAAEAFHGSEHVSRWRRVLVAFGETVSGFTGIAMTAVEAQSFADKGWSRWDPVVVALTALEAQASTDTTSSDQTDTTETESETSESVYVVPASLVNDVKGYAAETGNGAAHVNRWKRVLLAFGESVPGFTGSSMTVSEAQQNARTFWSVRWDPVVAALQALAAVSAPAATTPEVSIAAGSDVVEGSNATFTLAASPAPAANLDVTVTVSATGSYGVTTGSQIVSIPTSGSATFTVATSGDTVDEVDGSVTVTLVDGAGYDLDSSASAASVTVSDDDNPPPPPVPEVSITAGSTVTEGSNATFTLAASPAPTSPLGVSVNVTASGDYGVTAGSQTVSIPTSGSATFTVATSGDSTDEPDGSVTVTLAAGTGYDLDSSASSASVNISDDDNPLPPPVPEVSITAGSTVTEGGSALFTLAASPVPAASLGVSVNVTSRGSYGVTTGSQTVTIGTSGTTTFTVATSGDSIDEPDGSVTVTLATGSGYDLDSSASTATVSISDDDDPLPPPPPLVDVVTISVQDSIYVEGRSPFYLVRFKLNKPASERVTVKYTPGVLGIGAGYATAGEDFVVRTSSISFRPGVTSNIGLIYALNDRVKEPDETFTIVLSEPEGAQIVDSQPVLTIKDND